MKPWIKALLWLFGGLLLLLVTTIVAAVLLFDGERIRAVLVETVAEKTGRTLVMGEAPQLAIWPSIGIRLGTVTLSERSSPEEFAGIDAASLSVALLPLFRGELVADAVNVTGLRAHLVRGEDGRLNIDDLIGKEAPTPEKAGAEPAGAPKETEAALRFDVAGVRIEGRELSWRDRQAKQALSVHGFSLTTGRLGPGAEGVLDLQAAVRRGGEGGTADELQVSLRAPYRLGERAVELTGLQANVSGRAAGIEALRVALAASAVTLASDGRSAGAQALSVDIAGRLGQLEASARVAAPETSWQPAEGGGELKIPAASLSAHAAQGAGSKVEAMLTGAFTLRSAVDGLRVKLADWQGEAVYTDAGLLQKPMKWTVGLTAAIDLDGPSGDADLRLGLDGASSRLQATLKGFSPLDLVADIRLGKLDLDAYLLPPPAAAAPTAAGEPGKATADPPIDLSPLAGKRVRARIESAGIKARGVVIDQALLEARLANGQLDLAPLGLALYGGRVDGEASAMSGNALAARLKLSNVDLKPLLRDVASTELLAGRADVVADLAARGATVAAMKRALSGDIRLAVRDGAIQGVNLGRAFRELKAKFSRGEASEVAARSDAQTDFSELTASFQVREGVLRGNDLSAKSPFLRLSGAGEVSLPGETLDYLLKATVVNTSTGQGGDDLGHLKGLTVPVRLRGPLAAPSWKIEFGGLAGEAAKAKLAEKQQAAKAKLEENKDAVREQVRDKARDKLKSLLGR